MVGYRGYCREEICFCLTIKQILNNYLLNKIKGQLNITLTERKDGVASEELDCQCGM